MKNDCKCDSPKVATIAVAEYNKNNQLELFKIEVCEKCKEWYESLGLVLSEDDIKKYFD